MVRKVPAVRGPTQGIGVEMPQRRVPSAVVTPADAQPPTGRVAAFFDLDKTVIAKASMVAFTPPLHRAGLLTRRLLLRAAWGQLIYKQLGASADKLQKMRESVLRLTMGWDQAAISEIVAETLHEVIEPIIYDEALDLIREHQAAGHRVVIVSAAPEEVVAPIAQRLGVDEAIATRAELDEHGRYSGRTERYVYGAEKAVAIEEAAARDGLDLAASYAYSDSATDIPMLDAVGHAIAVNPDRELARVARERGWEIRRFTRTVAMRDRVPVSAQRRAAVGGGAAVVAVGSGAAAYLWWSRRHRPEPEPLARRMDQTVRTFLAATAAKAMSTTRSTSFFMDGDRSHRRGGGGRESNPPRGDRPRHRR
jgi:HAD superfamily hydrolase (TIGR01490 family)